MLAIRQSRTVMENKWDELWLPQITAWRAFPGHSKGTVTHVELSSHLELRRWIWEPKEAKVARVPREGYWRGGSHTGKVRFPSSNQLHTDQHMCEKATVARKEALKTRKNSTWSSTGLRMVPVPKTQIWHSFLMKTLDKLEIEGNFSTWLRTSIKKCTLTFMIKDGMLSLLRSGTGQSCPLSPLFSTLY